jgi:hypothetical protein
VIELAAVPHFRLPLLLSISCDTGLSFCYLIQLLTPFFSMYKLARKGFQKFSEKRSRPNGGQAQKPRKEPCRHQVTAGTPEAAGTAITAALDESVPCTICKQQKHDARVYRWKLIGGLILPYTLASMDLTIVATSLPFIASYFSASHCSVRLVV